MGVKTARVGGDSARGSGQRFDLLAPEYEYLDPNPDLHALFQDYNVLFFDGKLAGCEVKWSPRMTLCAGLCSYQPRSGFCSIRLSEPLLKLRPRSDMINTLLHEMIHAYVFVSSRVKDHDDHGPVFQSHMHRINQDAGTKISVFHTFHDEVDAYRQHWWKCDKPYFGLVKRAMNRPPGPTDRWWPEHQQKCGGTYTKIKEPAEFTRKQEAKKLREEKKRARESPSVEGFFTVTSKKDAEASKKRDQQDKSSGNGKKKAKKKAPEQDKKPKSEGKSGEEKPRGKDDLAGVTSGGTPHSPSFFPVVVTTGVNGEEELLLVGDIDVVLGGGVPYQSFVWQDAGSLTRPPPRTSQGGVVDLTFSESESEEEKSRVPILVTSRTRGTLPSTSNGRSTSSQSSAAPDVIEID